MILVDSGPLVALFEKHDHHHESCHRILKSLDDKLATTTPVLTEALHLLHPGSPASFRLTDYIRHGGLTVLAMEDDNLRRCFDLMERYADTPMDFAAASIVAAAEDVGTDKVFTLDHKHFGIYRITRGYHQVPFRIVGDSSGPQLVRERVAETEAASIAAPGAEEPVG